MIRKNLSVKLGDVVPLHSAAEVMYGTRIHVLLFKDSVNSITGLLFDTYGSRIVKKGDFQVRWLPDRGVQVIEAEVKEEPDEDVCIVAPVKLSTATGTRSSARTKRTWTRWVATSDACAMRG